MVRVLFLQYKVSATNETKVMINRLMNIKTKVKEENK